MKRAIFRIKARRDPCIELTDSLNGWLRVHPKAYQVLISFVVDISIVSHFLPSGKKGMTLCIKLPIF